MIQAALVAMTVMGCNHQDMNCDLLSRTPTVWLSREACEAAIPTEIVKPTDALYPIIIARCDVDSNIAIAAGPTPKAGEPLKHSTENAAGEPVVIVAAGDFERRPEAGQDRSMAGALLYRTKNGYALVRDGAAGGFALLRDGAVGGYARLRDGVKATAGATDRLARRAAGAVRNIIPSAK